MVIKVGINGFGRIGRVIFRKCFENIDIELSAINDPAVDIEYICYLIKFDSTHGKFRGNITHKDNDIIINDRKIKVFRERLPPNVPWQTVGVQYVVEASGMFSCLEKASGHLASKDVKRVIVTAPSVDIPMVILGVNHDKLKMEHKVLSCSSSTLYCLAPIIKVLQDSFGVVEGFVTSIHAMTPSLKPLDGLCLRGKHWRDHRSIHQNIIPANTGACKALGKIIPEVKDKLAGVAFRVPIVNVSVLDITIRLHANTTMTDIVKSVEKASATYLQNIIKISNENAVSSDFIGDNYSCILDVDSSLELKPNFYKLICWYENEYSYACRVLDTIFFSERQISNSALISRKWVRLRSEHVRKNTLKDCNQKNEETKLSAINLSDDNCKANNTQNTRSLILENPMPTREKKKKYEIFKVWNDDCAICKSNMRKNYDSFFHCCKGIKFTNNDVKNEHFINVKQETSKMIIITENLHKTSYSKNIGLETIDNYVSEEKASDAYRSFKIEPIEDVDAHSKRKYNITKTNDCLSKDCGDFENKLGSDYNKIKEEIKMNIDTSNKEIKYSCEKMNKTFLIDLDENKTMKAKDKEFRIIEDKIDHVSGTDEIANKGIGNDLNIDLKEPVADKCYDLKKSAKNHVANLCNRFILAHSRIFDEIQGGSNEQVSSNIIDSGLDSYTSIKNNICNTHNSQHKPTVSEDKYSLKKLADNVHILDKELKKRNIIIIESDTNSNFAFIDTKLLPPVVDNRCIIETDVVVSDEVLQLGGCRNILSIVQDDRKRKSQDIFDKLDSSSATDSNDSFDINERKSQVIHITDLTNSLDDLSRLDKICRIIEISDELSEELFSALNRSANSKERNKPWSFKDLCERIKLDDFCNKVFGETGV